MRSVLKMSVFCCALAVASAGVEAAAPSESPRADQSLSQGWEAYRRGDFEGAVGHWGESAAAYRLAGLPAGQIEAFRHQSAALRALGRYPAAVDQLRQAIELAEDTEGNGDLLVGLYDELGVVLTLTQDLDAAGVALERGLAMAIELKNRHAQASILNNLGHLWCAQEKYDKALQSYYQCIDLSQQEDNRELLATATTNAAMAALLTDEPARAAALAQQAQAAAEQLTFTHEQAFLLITLGHVHQALTRRSVDDPKSGLGSALKAYQLGFNVAKNVGDHRGMAYALEGIAQLYESQGRTKEALTLIQRAGHFADQSHLSHAAVRLRWQQGRFLASLGRRKPAIEAYRHAVESLGSVRQETAIGVGNRFASFGPRQDANAILSELADLLLQEAEVTEEQAHAQRLMREAIRTLERLKTAELVNYFEDQCIEQLQTRTVRIDQIASDTAVIYYVSLPRRTEILLAIDGQLQRFMVTVDRDQMVQTVQRLRYELEDLSTRRDLGPAQEIYQWLIAPIETALRSAAIDTLVFVPDGPLRLIPMAALYDGKQYLIQQYATAVTPGLTLTDPKGFEPGEIRLLAGGLTAPVQEGYAPLSHVKEEIDQVSKIFGGKKLIDENFVLGEFEQQLRQSSYHIVHIASHGRFGARPDQTYVLAHDTKITLADLESMIRPAYFRDQPIELLTLSACQTAAGDNRAALGLAGIAVKAGARSALATLWSVHDQTSAILMTEFYRQIHDDPGISKAQALQRAQMSLLDHPMHQDPYFWSPFLIIGNWQ